MKRVLTTVLASLGVTVGCMSLPSSAYAAAAGGTAGGTCTLKAVANLSPGLGATAKPFSVTFDGTLSNCQGTSPNTPSGGSLQAGLAGAPVPTGTGSCQSSTVTGYTINRWTDGNTTVVQFSATGALTALALHGQVVDHVGGFTTTEPTTPVGSAVTGALVLTASNPLACLPSGAGITTATVQGQLTHTNS